MWGKADPRTRTRTRTGRRVGRGKHGSRYCRLPQRVPPLLTCRYPHHFHPALPPRPRYQAGQPISVQPRQRRSTTRTTTPDRPAVTAHVDSAVPCQSRSYSALIERNFAGSIFFFFCLFIFFVFLIRSLPFSLSLTSRAPLLDGWMVYRWNVYFFHIAFLNLFLCFWIFFVFFSFFFFFLVLFRLNFSFECRKRKRVLRQQ